MITLANHQLSYCIVIQVVGDSTKLRANKISELAIKTLLETKP